VERVDCCKPDLIIGWYWEPYGVAASIVGKIFDIPVALVHAGSDLGRLAKQVNLMTTYALCTAEASFVVTSRHPDAQAALDVLRVGGRKRVFFSGSSLPPVYFKPLRSFSFEDIAEPCLAYLQKLLDGQVDHRRLSAMFERAPRPQVLQVGFFGKIGRVKGTFELIAALNAVAEAGVDFEFVYLAAGEPAQFTEVFEMLRRHPRIEERCRILPPLAPWRVPEFLHACDVACFLEHAFPISFHTPSVPLEILASGAALICSAEIVNKSALSKLLVHGKNAIVIPDPKQTTEFADILCAYLSDRQRLRSIGWHGRLVAEGILSQSSGSHVLSELIDKTAQRRAISTA
jgi:glycosyltransferase involved in cell wall biosynthesis